MPEVRPIDANALNFEKLQDTNGKTVPMSDYIAYLNGAIAAEELVKNAPTLDYEPVVHAHWIEDDDCQICSNCGEEHCWAEYRASYCEDCGAKMDEEVK